MMNKRFLSFSQRLLHIGLSLIVLTAMFTFMVGPAVPSVQAVAANSTVVDEKIDSALAAKLRSVSSLTPLEVVIVFSNLSAAPRVRSLSTTFLQMQTLPMAGAVLTAARIRDLSSWPEIYSITLNQPLKYFLHESVPLIKADQVWNNYGETGGNTTVAVIDSGIDASHPDLPLGSKVIQNVKIVPFSSPLENQLVSDTSSGHGTHVAGTIGGTGAASNGYYKGVAPNVKLVGVGAGEVLFILTATQAYDWVLSNYQRYGIRVISNSWGSTGGGVNVRNPVVMASLEAYNRGILSIFAAGNDGGYDVMNPYSIAPWVLSVAAGTKAGQLADFSSRGQDGDYFKHPDITAPGVSIYSTRSKTIGITALDPLPNPVNPLWTPYYTVMDGTSMATPHVSGSAALLFSHNPNLSPDQVIDLLTANASAMPGYQFHEVGYGYLDVLAAYQDSLDETGNLQAFLAGERLHTIEEVHGFDPALPVQYDETTFSGSVQVGASEPVLTGASAGAVEHQIDLTENSGILYVDVNVSWTPQQEDAFDLVILDPQGDVVMTSGNGVGEGESALFVPRKSGVYTIRLQPFVAATTAYEVHVKTAYGTPPANWPPTGTPEYDYYLGLTDIYKLHGVLGLASRYYRSGDAAFAVFSFIAADGLPILASADKLQAIYTDRNGNVGFVDNAIVDRDGGEYESNFDTLSPDWQAAPGPVTLSFGWAGGGNAKLPTTTFYYNYLDVTLTSTATQYNPGDTVTFSGAVNQVDTVAAQDIQHTPVGGAQVTVSLVNSNGETLAASQVQTDALGGFSGSLAAPTNTRGIVQLVAESTYTDPTILLGNPEWYGEKELELQFPGNLPPTASLQVTQPSNENTRFFLHIQSSAADPDGAADIRGINLSLSDSKGRLLKRWSLSDFSQLDELSWSLETSYRVSGKAPWTLTLTVTDSAAQTATATQTIQR
jgi:serine protease AprX